MEQPDYYHENQSDAAPSPDECPKCMRKGKFQRAQWLGVAGNGDEIEIDIYKCESCDIEFDGS